MRCDPRDVNTNSGFRYNYGMPTRNKELATDEQSASRSDDTLDFDYIAEIIAERVVTILIALHTDSPVPISLLKGFCSHNHLHREYLGKRVQHFLIDGKTCVRISQFVQAREQRNKKSTYKSVET